jgi:hypothetical protein
MIAVPFLLLSDPTKAGLKVEFVGIQFGLCNICFFGDVNK